MVNWKCRFLTQEPALQRVIVALTLTQRRLAFCGYFHQQPTCNENKLESTREQHICVLQSTPVGTTPDRKKISLMIHPCQAWKSLRDGLPRIQVKNDLMSVTEGRHTMVIANHKVFMTHNSSLCWLADCSVYSGVLHRRITWYSNGTQKAVMRPEFRHEKAAINYPHLLIQWFESSHFLSLALSFSLDISSIFIVSVE